MVWRVRAQQEELREKWWDVPIRVITAAAIFDGHDAAIGIFRRIFQSMGCEVIHLGHDRSAEDVAMAKLYKKTHLIAITSIKEVREMLYTRRTFDAAGFGHVVRMQVAHNTYLRWAPSRPDRENLLTGRRWELGLTGMVQDAIDLP